MRPRALVLTAPGINCDLELAEAFDLAGADAVRMHLNEIAADPSRIDEFDLIGLPGGFSYGDAIAAGRILAVMLRATVLDRLHAAVDRGVPMIAPCNGFQIAVQAGLLPGPRPDAPATTEAALLENDGGRFVDRWVRVEYPSSKCIWTQGLESSGAAAVLPIAHGEGRFHTSDATLARLSADECIAVRYAAGDDPNGSLGRVAGVCDHTGLVLGLMPHPERYLHWSQHPSWTRMTPPTNEPPGLQMFRSAVSHVLANRASATA
ncbi:MAG: phosphoribosylformylglycinamidine synthase subunit PurQ [Planctomycetes bacterium]|nr:phosphoribosylformylglycinamidine synthase subunit PurQ [Planctomycetota bacterium]MCP4839945.1 phosphoribosylformylglycinamidine synthase subunit PurQ [Planctomycetota bacterium]